MPLPEAKLLDEIKLNFIVGMGRSGTTLLTSVFNNHPRILSTPENNFLVFNLTELKKQELVKKERIELLKRSLTFRTSKTLKIWSPTPRYVNEVFETVKTLNLPRFIKLLYLYYPLSASKSSLSCIVDKNPEYSLHAFELKELFPDARFIILVRSFRDNIASRKKVDRSLLKSVTILAESWNCYYRKLIRFAGKYPNDSLIVHYEKLVSNTEHEIKRICEFLDVPFDPSMLAEKDYRENLIISGVDLTESEKERVNKMHANLGKKIDQEQINGWKSVLTEREVETVDFLCDEISAQMGANTSGAQFSLLKKIWLFFRTRPLVYFTRVYIHLFDYKFFYLPLRFRLIFKKRKNLES